MFHHVVDDIERVGDHVVNIAQRADRAQRAGHRFSEDAVHDLNDMFDRVRGLYRISLRALQGEDREAANEAFLLEKNVDRLEIEYKANHVHRLESGRCNPEGGILFVEILHNLERIGDHAVNIAGDVLMI